MKTKYIGFQILAIAALMGCTKSSNNVAPTPATGCVAGMANCGGTNTTTNNSTTTTTGEPPAPPAELTTGGTATLVVTNSAVLSDYAGRVINNPSTVQLNMNVAGNGGNPNVYFGTTRIRYNDDPGNGTVVLHDQQFENGSSAAHGNNVHILTKDSRGVPTYRFFFEDTYGAIIVVMQNTRVGDSGTSSTLAGFVFYRNFQANSPNPLYQGYWDPVYGVFYPPTGYNFCWSGQIKGTPYDCRNWSINPTTDSYKPFKMLGYFTGLNKTKAIGN